MPKEETGLQSVADTMNSSVATDESLSIRSNRGLRNLVFWQSCLLVSQATVGYDEVLVGSLQTMPKWLEGNYASRVARSQLTCISVRYRHGQS
jgi:hypothetical protein